MIMIYLRVASLERSDTCTTTINLQVDASDKRCFVRAEVDRSIRKIVVVQTPSKWHCSLELGTEARIILCADEGLGSAKEFSTCCWALGKRNSQPCIAEERAYGVDADSMRSIFGRETLGDHIDKGLARAVID